MWPMAYTSIIRWRPLPWGSVKSGSGGSLRRIVVPPSVADGVPSVVVSFVIFVFLMFRVVGVWRWCQEMGCTMERARGRRLGLPRLLR